MTSHQTIDVSTTGGVTTVRLDRPDSLNAFDSTMVEELRETWRALRFDDACRVVVLTGSGDRAFCTGIDRRQINLDWADTMVPDSDGRDPTDAFAVASPFMFDDPGASIGPKSNDLWKPVIAAVNGMACGGAFYLLGEVDFMIAADHATFFDPHVTYGMPTVFEPIHMAQRMPLGEVMRMSLLGNAERMTAARAHQIGLVTEVVPGPELAERARWAADRVAEVPGLAAQATVRAIWASREMGKNQALSMASMMASLGTTTEGLQAGQRLFSEGSRTEPRLR